MVHIKHTSHYTSSSSSAHNSLSTHVMRKKKAPSYSSCSLLSICAHCMSWSKRPRLRYCRGKIVVLGCHRWTVVFLRMCALQHGRTPARRRRPWQQCRVVSGNRRCFTTTRSISSHRACKSRLFDAQVAKSTMSIVNMGRSSPSPLWLCAVTVQATT